MKVFQLMFATGFLMAALSLGAMIYVEPEPTGPVMLALFLLDGLGVAIGACGLLVAMVTVPRGLIRQCVVCAQGLRDRLRAGKPGGLKSEGEPESSR